MKAPLPFDTLRVVDTRQDAEGVCHAVVLAGEGEAEIPWPLKAAPRPGDIFAVASRDPLAPGAWLGGARAGALRPDSDALRWRRRLPSGQTRRGILAARHAIRRAVRDYLDAEGFIEVDSPLLVHGTTPDLTISSFKVGDRYLVTSTEYQIKRLEVAGFDRTYTLTQNFRATDDPGTCHNPEFTMLEWARVGAPLSAIEQDVETCVRRGAEALGGGARVTWNGHCVDLRGTWERLSVAEAVRRHTGVALESFEAPSLRAALEAAGVAFRPADAEDPIFLFSLLADTLQPHLGLERPTFLVDWPAFQTASTPEAAGKKIAERSELFIAGLELADGFPTLTDADVQRTGFAQQQDARRQRAAPTVALDDRYLAAMEDGMPRGAGMALGFDRLVMLLTGAPDIRSTLAFAWDEA